MAKEFDRHDESTIGRVTFDEDIESSIKDRTSARKLENRSTMTRRA